MSAGRAAALALTLFAGDRGDRLRARLGGRLAVDVARELARLDGVLASRAARARRLAEEVGALRAPIPDGLALVHRDWLGGGAVDGRGADAPSPGRPDGAPTPVEVWRSRSSFASITAMPTAAATPIVPSRIAALEPAALERLIRRAGLVVLARSLQGQPARVLVEIALALGEDGALLFGLAGAEPDPSRPGRRRAALAVVDGTGVGRDPEALFVIGARALAPHLVELEARQVAQRLSRALGLRWLAARAAVGEPAGFAWEDLVIP